jgi:redox-sensitive bicupin YhaK (pirin superfamily)
MTAAGASRNVAKVSRAHARIDNAYLRVDNVTAYQLQLDPFLGMDCFAMRVPRSPPHPHAGFCAVTYLFKDSEGGLVSRDSLGHSFVIRPGDLCWTTAGRGIVHEEVPETPDRAARGLQIFVNLPADRKRDTPSVSHVDRCDVPVVTWGDGRARVLVGQIGAVASPIAAPHPVTLLDVELDPGGQFEHALPADESVTAWVLQGHGVFGRAHRSLRCREACAFLHDGGRIEMRAGRHGMRVAVFAGRPLGEPVVARGPFIMSTDEELEEAYRDFRLGRMGKLAASF